jgi:hypothetical protein
VEAADLRLHPDLVADLGCDLGFDLAGDTPVGDSPEVCGPVCPLLAEPCLQSPRAGDADFERRRGERSEIDGVFLVTGL